MEKLNGEYIRGYTKALVDIQNYFREHTDSLKTSRLYNAKGIDKLLSAFIFCRDELRETGTVDLKYSEDNKEIYIHKKTNEYESWFPISTQKYLQVQKEWEHIKDELMTDGIMPKHEAKGENGKIVMSFTAINELNIGGKDK